MVLEGDETGQELLEQSGVLDPALLELELDLERYDLSLEHRRTTGNEVVSAAAAAMREAGLGLKAATITPEGADDVGSPNRILREQVNGKVIVRTGRLPGVTPIAGVHCPISIVRMAVEDASGAEECRAVAEYAFRTAAKVKARVHGGPKWTVSPAYEGMLKEELDEAASRHPEVGYRSDRQSPSRLRGRRGSVRATSYSYEHMFLPSVDRMRAWLRRAEDILGEPLEDAHRHQDRAFSHPHRRPLRWEPTRRAGAVAARPAHCISPLRAAPDAGRRDLANH